MNRPYVFLLAATFLAVGFTSGTAQTRLKHFTFVANTGNNATVGIPASANPNVAGTALTTGDEIGVFTPDGLCVGAVVWTAGAGAAITVWGDNDQTTLVDGIRAGEQIMFCVWRQTQNLGYSEVTVTYSVGDGRYAVNGINAVATLVATSTVTLPLAPKLGAPNNNATNAFVNPFFQWYTACSARTYELQVSTSSTFATLALSRSGIDSTYHEIRSVATSNHLLSNTTYFWRVRAINSTGVGAWSTVWSFTTGITVGVAASRSEMLREYALAQNYPNPFNPSTTIKFALPEAGKVTLQIFNETGQFVRALADGEMNVGRHEISWDGRNQVGAAAASGIYFYRLVVHKSTGAVAFTETKRMVFVR